MNKKKKKNSTICKKKIFAMSSSQRSTDDQQKENGRRTNHNNLFFRAKKLIFNQFFSFSFYDNIRCKKTKNTPWLLVNSVSREVHHYYYSLPNLLRWKEPKLCCLRAREKSKKNLFLPPSDDFFWQQEAIEGWPQNPRFPSFCPLCGAAVVLPGSGLRGSLT